MKLFRSRFIYFIFIFLVIFSCKNNDPEPANVSLLKSELVSTLTREEFITKLQLSFGNQANQLSLFVRSGLKLYRITYKTKDPSGNEVTASGAFIIPSDIKDPLALASLQHGTIFNETDAPSYFKFETEVASGALLASTGLFIGMPDYLGYGASKTSQHPYEHRIGLAQPNVDFIVAMKEFIKSEKLSWNNNLLLAGYSEGGFATMATYKLLEDSYKGQFNIKAVSCGAGAYNKTKTMTTFLTTKTSGEVTNNRSYVWVLLTYDKLYKLNRPISSYFREPFSTDISKNGINVNINRSFDEILNPTFSNGILKGTDESFLNAVKDNDVFDWKPSAPLRLYHGDKDTYVPFLNSETANAAMLKKGATQLELIPIVGGDHSSSITTYFLGTFDLFNKYKN